jgi:hypothetical protein
MKSLILDTDVGGGARMTRDVLTRDSVLATLDEDARLKAPQDKCAVLHWLVKYSRGFNTQDYAARPECASYPLDQYPWS